MSSSGLIYAVIVGAWAAYLVPMWLRREDELNRARQTQRYSTAIKVLANKESFERRLPVAVGQTGYVPGSGAGADPVQSAPTRSGSASGAARSASGRTAAKAGPAKRPVPAKKTLSAGAAAGTSVTARVDRSGRAGQAPAAGAPGAQSARINVINRRRRVVSVLFTLTTLGTLVTADLGPAMLWTMALPALVLSAYIVWLRKDERSRAAARAGRQAAAAAQARLAATAERQRLDRERAAEAEAEELRQAQSARRRTAAARARADRYTTATDPALRRAAGD
jgi:hypothetical protein